MLPPGSRELCILWKGCLQQQNTITDLTNQINTLNSIKRDHENVKSQVTHLETFRNELVKSREDIKNIQSEHEKNINQLNTEHKKVVTELNDKIEYLQLTPAKRKKIDDSNKKDEEPVGLFIGTPASQPTDTVIKDGGSF